MRTNEENQVKDKGGSENRIHSVRVPFSKDDDEYILFDSNFKSELNLNFPIEDET